MIRTLSGIAAGIYVAQEYPSDIPKIKPIIQTLIRDIQDKSIEYTIKSNTIQSNKPK